MKVALLYAITVPPKAQKLLEWSIFLLALFSLFILAYLHVAFIRTPINCLESHQNDWPKDGILRVEIVSDPAALQNDRGHTPPNLVDYSESPEGEPGGDGGGDGVAAAPEESANTTVADGLADFLDPPGNEQGYPTPLKEKMSHLEMFARAVWPNENYIVEYSLEYGFLRLSPKTRQRLNIQGSFPTMPTPVAHYALLLQLKRCLWTRRTMHASVMCLVDSCCARFSATTTS